MALTVTFKVGSCTLRPPETAVQNRINRAATPARHRAADRHHDREAVQQPTMVVHLLSPDGSRDALYLRNYGQLNVRDELLRVPAWAM